MTALLLLTALLAAAPARADSAEDSALESLHAASAAARERACAALAAESKRGPRVYDALLTVLDRDLSERVRLAAGKAVITFPGDDALHHAEAFLKSEPGEQNRIAFTLALSSEPSRLEDSGVTDLIASMLSDDPNAEVRRAAAFALERRGDTRALPAVRFAAEKDADKSARDAARAALRVLLKPRPRPKVSAPKAAKPKAGAVKGTDPCPEPYAWCECSGPIKHAPKCLTRSDCRIDIDTMIQLGMPCTWSGLTIGAPGQ